MKKVVIAVLIATMFMFSACGKEESNKSIPVEVETQDDNVNKEIKIEDGEIEESDGQEVVLSDDQDNGELEIEENVKLSNEDYQNLGVNELGQVMVIMYHSLGEKNEAYIRTPEDFRKDLNVLYDNGYRLVSLEDYANNNIDIEAGFSPVVLTFDDGHITNFNITEENGEKKVDPNCVVGIMEAFYSEHPDFGLEATFFLNGGTPFGQKEYVDYKLNYIIDKGMDLGNHSYNHDNFKEISSEKLQTTLGRTVEMINEYVPDYKVNTLALPFGISPKNDNVKKYLYDGKYNDMEYENIAVLKVGWKPEVSAAHKDFNFKSINRVQSGEGDYQFSFWFDDLQNNPSKKYISDGNSKTLVVPEKYLNNISEEMKGKFEVITY